jgi:hypothetical protein
MVILSVYILNPGIVKGGIFLLAPSILIRTSKGNLQFSDDVEETSPSHSISTLSQNIHNQNNNALLISPHFHHGNASIYRN